MTETKNNPAMQQVKEALEYLDRVAAIAFQEERYEDAETAYRQVIESTSKLGLTATVRKNRMNLASVLACQGRTAEALEELTKIESELGGNTRNPEWRPVQELKARILNSMGKHKSALQIAQQLELASVSPLQRGQINLLKSDIYYSTGNRVMSSSNLNRAIDYLEMAGDKNVLANALAIRIRRRREWGEGRYVMADEERLRKLMK